MVRIQLVIALLALGPAGLRPAPVLAQTAGAPQPTLVRLDLAVTPTDRDRTFDVVADIVVAADSVDELPLTILERSPRRIVNLRIDGGTTIVIDRERTPSQRASVPLDAADRDGRNHIRLRYEVEDAASTSESATSDTTTLEIPIPVPAWPPRTTGDDAFTARLTLPTARDVVRAFPTSMTKDGDDRFVASLPVPPAFVALTTAPSGQVGVTAERVADVAALGLLVLLLSLALIRLRRTFR